MSAISNNNWYNLNSTRKYPLDEGCSGVDDQGTTLPATIITDLNIRLPLSVGQGAMLSSLVVTNNLVAATFLATDRPIVEYFSSSQSSATAPDYFKPLCAVSLVKPVEIGVPYPLTAFVDGVLGWIVFGEGINTNYNGKFASIEQSGLSTKVCRYYRDYPVKTIGKKDSTTLLSGLVKLVEGRDVSITKQERTIDGELKTAVVFSLKDRTTESVLSLYNSPCNARPESKTCDMESLEFINSVGPDCSGNINVIFENPFRAAEYPNGLGGIALDYPIGLIDACTAKDNLPDSTGRLPTEYQNNDECNSSSITDPDENVLQNTGVLPPPQEISSTTIDIIDLPASLTFNSESTAYWQTVLGNFVFITDLVPLTDQNGNTSIGYSEGTDSGTIVADESYASSNNAGLNVSLWFNGDYSTTLNKRIRTDLKLIEINGYGNGFLVLNYRANNSGTSDQFFAIEISKPTASFNIKKFNGLNFTVLGTVSDLPIEPGGWYRIQAEITQGTSPSLTQLNVKLYALADMSLLAALVIQTNSYLPATGKVGIGSYRAEARFASFYMEEIV
jgi:hypothetical protein